MNHRKFLATLGGLAVLAGVSYHQVRDAGPDPRDTAIMSGTIVSSDRAAGRTVDANENDASCDASPADRPRGIQADPRCPEKQR